MSRVGTAAHTVHVAHITAVPSVFFSVLFTLFVVDSLLVPTVWENKRARSQIFMPSLAFCEKAHHKNFTKRVHLKQNNTKYIF